MKIEENISAKKFSTFRIGGSIRYYAIGIKLEDIEEAIQFAEDKKIPLVIVGEGSNTIWTDTDHDILALSIQITDISVVSDDTDSVVWKIGAGVNWDNLVEKSVSEGLFGIECMSGIPGSVGAAPVQNIGAYGQEVKDVLVSVSVYDFIEKREKVLTREQCNFSYRNSIFKSSEKGRYLILFVTIKLSKKPNLNTQYESLNLYLKEHNIVNPTLLNIRESVLTIRSTKLPDPKVIANCGSFFENPIIPIAQANALKEKYPDIKIFKTENSELIKISAGWLIEKVGLKGKDFGNIKVYENNALVLTNKGAATYQDLLEAKNIIISGVKEMFGIELEMEPNVI